MQLYKNNCWML